MTSLQSFTSPTGMLTVANTGLIVGLGVWVNNKVNARENDISNMQRDLKHNIDEMVKVKDYLKQMDPKQIPKIANLIDEIMGNMGTMGRKLNGITEYLNVQEEKNSVRDKNMTAIYDYIAEKDPDNAPEFEDVIQIKQVRRGRRQLSLPPTSKPFPQTQLKSIINNVIPVYEEKEQILPSSSFEEEDDPAVAAIVAAAAAE